MHINKYPVASVIPIPETEQRKIQMAIEMESLHPIAIDLEVTHHVASQNLLAQLFQFLDPLLLILSQ